MKLNQLADNEGARSNRKRVGRGNGSGTGTTAGRGQKGQKSRSGVSLVGFEGGQMPLYRRLPKRGFNNKKFAKRFAAVNIGVVQRAVDAGRLDAKKTVDHAALCAAGICREARDGVRLLAKGEIKTKLNFEVAGASKTAIEAVEKAGGKVAVAAPAAGDAAEGTKAPAKAKKASAKTEESGEGEAESEAES
ncbi:MAG: 50S ribosomal protein L15 [Rhodospirillaceae bacterium]|nr:50S ribosomal protein L15 [Rhodospirillaceae bacterium]MBT6117878.1 50S ribosomal protein L15 [Rhodospirillaceae bacterium]